MKEFLMKMWRDGIRFRYGTDAHPDNVDLGLLIGTIVLTVGAFLLMIFFL